jgi:hypothetical protein
MVRHLGVLCHRSHRHILISSGDPRRPSFVVVASATLKATLGSSTATICLTNRYHHERSRRSLHA